MQEIARHRGLLATFMAKRFNDEGGSGFHVHVSVNDDTGPNVFGDNDGPDGLSPVERFGTDWEFREYAYHVSLPAARAGECGARGGADE